MSNILPYSLPIKILAGSLFAILGGSGLLGFLSEFATYFYAISYGFRPPVEGVPYLRASVTFISLALILGAIFGFVVIFLLAKLMVLPFDAPMYFLSKFKSTSNPTPSVMDIYERMRSRSLKHVLVVSTTASLVVSLSLIFFLHSENKFDANHKYIFAFFGFFSGSLVLYVCTFRPSWLKVFTGIGALAFVVTFPSMMFHLDTYSKFMRVSGFGGGKIISVTYKLNALDGDSKTLNGGLLLRTTDYLIIYHSDNKEIIEIPITNVEKIAYQNGNQYSLPDKK